MRILKVVMMESDLKKVQEYNEIMSRVGSGFENAGELLRVGDRLAFLRIEMSSALASGLKLGDDL